MKRFKFRYQTLLDVRERAQRLEEEALQHHLASLARAEEELGNILAQSNAQQEAWVAAQGAPALNLDDVTMIQRFMLVLDQRTAKQRQVVGDAKARVDNQRELLAEAMRQVEVIKQLKERDEKAWRAAIERNSRLRSSIR